MCKIEVSTEKIGTRIYVRGNTFAIKDQLKSAGCHWDGERRQWWIGATLADKIKNIVQSLDGQEIKEDVSANRLHGKAKYKGRSYYVLAVSDQRLRLTVLDGSIIFWADRAACEWEKSYSAREYHGHTTYTTYTTLASIRSFVADQKNPATSRGPCTECGSWGPSGEPCQDCGGEGHHA